MKRLGESLNSLSGALLGFTTALICADVLLRLLRSPIPGSYDIVEFLTSIMISLAILKSFQNGEQISVDIADKIFPKRLIPAIDVISRIITSIFLCILSIGALSSSVSSYLSSEVSMTLGLPLYPVYLGIGLTSGLAFINEALRILKAMLRLIPIVKLGREKA